VENEADSLQTFVYPSHKMCQQFSNGAHYLNLSKKQTLNSILRPDVNEFFCNSADDLHFRSTLGHEHQTSFLPRSMRMLNIGNNLSFQITSFCCPLKLVYSWRGYGQSLGCSSTLHPGFSGVKVGWPQYDSVLFSHIATRRVIGPKFPLV